jgi:hypothetical protein
MKTILLMKLKNSQMKEMMELAIRYFYLFHHEKKMSAANIFVETYHKLTDPVRFALSDEFILFFRIATKIGKSTFVSFLS